MKQAGVSDQDEGGGIELFFLATVGNIDLQIR